jgi:DNA (cytosine-5)-methyltransferase 1
MNHIGLFEGIGGFSLAARWIGWETIAWCEWNEFGQKVLKHHFPKAKAHGDITKTDFTIYRGQCDVLTGGFPCQPYSLAGKRKGKEDDRHLWPEMLRAIKEIQPTWVVGENVFGLVNWDGGLVFHEVQTDLEAAGYEVFPYVLPACAVNAPHRRDRVWFVAYSKTNRQNGSKAINKWKKYQPNDRNGIRPTLDTNGKSWIITNSNDTGNATHGCRTDGNGQAQSSQREHTQHQFSRYIPNQWQNFPTQSPICSGDDGVSTRLDSITFPKWRNESIKAAGNAIVPQVAFQIFKTIKLYNAKL